VVSTAFAGATVFDGTALRKDAVVVVDGGIVSDITEIPPPDAMTVRLDGGILAPGFLDLQVNGGGGIMVNGATDAAALTRICATLARLGTTGILPTLITDTPVATRAVIAAGIAACGVPGFLGLHLEGPHLDPRRKGAHDPALIRPMDADDLAVLLDAAARLPALMLTVAPCSVTADQIRQLADAGAIVSLGHTDCTHAEAQAAIAAGAGCATHLFNAMSPLGTREPGLVGAVLTSTIAAGIIADGIHVAPEALQIAMAARSEGMFLVSDCMAVAGTGMTEFTLNGRKILRRQCRLTLQDGTLAGADLTLACAVQVMVHRVGVPVARALAMATRVPADLLGRGGLGRLQPGSVADMVHLDAGLAVQAVWMSGQRVTMAPEI
jgi:N-acetylglucosamine-6-phosphate deacetylase